MTIATSIVDLSRLPAWPHRNQVRATVDPWHDLRMTIGDALAPPEIDVVVVTGALLLWRKKP